MSEIELKVRPRLRIGMGGQLSFLPGRREEVERIHRRAMGITPDDEAFTERKILFSIYGLMYLLKPWLCNIKYFKFGADLSEWEFGQYGDGKPRCMSRKRGEALALTTTRISD